MQALGTRLLSLAIATTLSSHVALAAGRRLLVSPNDRAEIYSPANAAAYLDGMFGDLAAARANLSGSFVKKSKVVVVYMCYERGDIIASTLTSLLMNEGVSNYDLVISQDGGSSYEVNDDGLEFVNSLYIRHPYNLCTGLHHYFVKRFAFDIMGYDTLVVVEEDNTLHPQALQMLVSMVDLSVPEKDIGLVSSTDMDNSLLLDETRYSNAVLRSDVAQGHLWVYALHTTRFNAVRQHLTDYYNVIKGRNYIAKSDPPLSDNIAALHAEKGFPKGLPLSQDAFFVHSLAKEGYAKRFTTMVRLFEPMGWEGLHFKQDPSAFYGLYGKGMYEGRIQLPPVDVTKSPEEIANIVTDCRERLDRIYLQYLGRSADKKAAETAVSRLLWGKMNAVELVRNVINSAEHRRRMKEWVTKAKKQ